MLLVLAETALAYNAVPKTWSPPTGRKWILRKAQASIVAGVGGTTRSCSVTRRGVNYATDSARDVLTGTATGSTASVEYVASGSSAISAESATGGALVAAQQWGADPVITSSDVLTALFSGTSSADTLNYAIEVDDVPDDGSAS